MPFRIASAADTAQIGRRFAMIRPEHLTMLNQPDQRGFSRAALIAPL
jgi:hypothetical protein